MSSDSIRHIKDVTDPYVGPDKVETYRDLRTRLSNEKETTIIQIPVHPREKSLNHLLQMYVDRPDLHDKPFRVVLLINNGTPEETDQRLAEIEVFTRQYPDFPLDCYFSKTPGVFQTISQVRASLGRLALEKLPDHSDETLRNSFFVTQDADMVEVYPDYFANLRTAFGDSRLHAFGGGIEFRTDSPLLRTLYKVDEEFYKLELNVSFIKPKMCGANSAFRALSYVTSGGFNPVYARKENTPIRDYLLENMGKDAARYQSDVAIATSARRTLTCLNSGGAFSYQHGNFGRPGDYMDAYHAHEETQLFSDSLPQPEKMLFLSRQLTGMLRKSVYLESTFLDKYVYKHRRKGVSALMPHILAQEELAPVRARIAGYFQEACRRSGMGVEISPDLEVVVRSYTEVSNRLS